MPSMVVTSKSGADWPTRLPVWGGGGAGAFVGGTGVGVSVGGAFAAGMGVGTMGVGGNIGNTIIVNEREVDTSPGAVAVTVMVAFPRPTPVTCRYRRGCPSTVALAMFSSVDMTL